MAPAEDARQDVEFQVAPLRVLGGEFLRGQEQRRDAIGDLRAVAHFDSPRDRLVELARLLRIAFAAWPARVWASGLRRALEKLIDEMRARYSSLSP